MTTMRTTSRPTCSCARGGHGTATTRPAGRSNRGCSRSGGARSPTGSGRAHPSGRPISKRSSTTCSPAGTTRSATATCTACSCTWRPCTTPRPLTGCPTTSPTVCAAPSRTTCTATVTTETTATGPGAVTGVPRSMRDGLRARLAEVGAGLLAFSGACLACTVPAVQTFAVGYGDRRGRLLDAPGRTGRRAVRAVPRVALHPPSRHRPWLPVGTRRRDRHGRPPRPPGYRPCWPPPDSMTSAATATDRSRRWA